MRLEVTLINDGRGCLSKQELEREMAFIHKLLPNAETRSETRGPYKAVTFDVDFYEWFRDLRDSIATKLEVMRSMQDKLENTS